MDELIDEFQRICFEELDWRACQALMHGLRYFAFGFQLQGLITAVIQASQRRFVFPCIYSHLCFLLRLGSCS